jgi:molybdopterin molybdotransferase
MMKPSTNLNPDQACALVLEGVKPSGREEVILNEALYRVTAEPLTARLEDPRFDKSAVDGIGVRGEDPADEFEIIGEIAAGDDKAPALKSGQAVRIMTGARVPPDVGRVIKFENCSFTAAGTVTGTVTGDDGTAPARARIVEPETITNIALRGENTSVGALLMPPRRLCPQDIGILAAQGYTTVPVHRKPRVAVIATGDEIYPAGAELPPSGIYDSNSAQLTASARSAHAEATNLGILVDVPERIRERLGENLGKFDVIVLSGGVSMGDLDFIPDALTELGARIVFHGLAVKPGRPTLFAVYQDGEQTTRVFGLPGNPVSTLVQFELLVKPLLYALEGSEYQPREGRLPLMERMRRRNADRHEFLPGVDRAGTVVPLRYKGSGHLSALAEATLIYRIDRGVESLEAGDEVYVRYLR